MQETPAGHTCPQEPQLKSSSLRLAQLPPQSVRSGLHEQFPFRQVTPQPEQIFPQEPQLKSSVMRSVQWKLQLVWPAEQPVVVLSLETVSFPSR